MSFRTRAAIYAAVIALSWSGAAASTPAGFSRIVPGSSVNINGMEARSWGAVGADGKVTQVGVTVPLAMIAHPPSLPGAGPSGSFLVLRFPEIVRSTTFFEHFEMHWNPRGHPPNFFVPHFDLHFYAIPVAEVFQIGARDPQPPTRDRVPFGYFYPSPFASVPQMGVHASAAAAGIRYFAATMIAGFFGGRMIFIEPMILQELLMSGASFDLPVPIPAALGRSALYPTRFSARFNRRTQAYDFVYTGFVPYTR